MKRVFIILLFVFAVFLELGFLPLLGTPWRLVMLAPLFLIVLVTREWGRELWFMAAGGGLILDTFSSYPPATFTVLFFILIFFVHALYYRWFTNRSPLSLLVISAISMTIFYSMLAGVRMITHLVTHDPFISLSWMDAVKNIGIGVSMSVGTLFIWLSIELYVLRFLGSYLMSPRRHQYLR